MKRENHDNEKRKFRLVVILLIIIIIILLLITSCTSKFWGRIGEYGNSQEMEIEDGSNDEKIIWNKNLLFDVSSFSMYLNDSDYKLSFTYKNIHPDKFTCTTSDSHIATCFVKNGAVIVYPKGVGDVDIIIEAKTNGKRYRAKASGTVKDANGYLALSSKKGTINLKGNKTIYVAYTLVNLKGDVHVVVRDPNIASASIKDGILTITGKKAGHTTITLSVVVGDVTYEVTYDLTVYDQEILGMGSVSDPHYSESKKPSKKDHDSSLKSLKSSSGTLHFESNVHEYYLSVENDVTKFTLDTTVSSKKAKEKYRVNGKEVDSLSDVELKVGNNIIEVEVTAEDGSKTTYTVTVERKAPAKSSDNALSNLTVSDGVLTPEFKEDVLEYHVSVSSKVNSLDLEIVTRDSKAHTTYKFNGKTVDDLKDLELKSGDNVVEVTVTSESGEERTYTVTIHKSVRKVEIEKDSYVAQVGTDTNIIYHVYEDDIELAPEEYDLSEVEVSWDGSYQGDILKNKGYLTIHPDSSMVGKKRELTVSSGDSSVKASVSFTSDTYYFRSYSDSYDLDITSDLSQNERDIVFDNNIFGDNVVVEKTPYGARIYDKDNPSNYLELTYDDDALDLESAMGSNSLLMGFRVYKSGNHNIHVKAFANGEVVNELDVTLRATFKYILTLDANGGTFDEFTNLYEFTVDENAEFDLTPYITGYIEKEDCLHYALVGFNTKSDGSGNRYDSAYTVTSDVTLYAVYSDEAMEEPVEVEKNLYLAEVDLFHNEEYFKLYNKDKVIYPGAHGYYIMTFDNNTSSDIEITSITLEEDTICVDDNVKGCLNMGYVVKDYENNYYMGNKDTYEILYKHSNTVKNGSLTSNVITFPTPLAVKKGEHTEISLLWQWVDHDDNGQNDQLDTYIGDMAADNLNDMYHLTVSIQFKMKKNACDGSGD